MDGMESLAVAILLASICILLIPTLLGAGLGYLAFRTVTAAVVGGLLGALIGVLGVTFTFFERRWNPPLELTIETPPGFQYTSVILLEDPSAPPLAWQGADLPLVTRRARLSVPASGVVRVQSVLDLMTNDRVARLSSGEERNGMRGGPAPAGFSGSMIVFEFARWDPDRPSLADQDVAAIAEAIRAREAAH